jgi:hypothetical protein
MRTVGFLDGLRDNGSLEGWALRLDEESGRPLGECSVRVMCDGVPLCRIVAKEARMDVAETFNAPRHCGFSYFPPQTIKRGIPHEFRFFHVVNGAEIQGSPCVVTLVVDNKQPYSPKNAVADAIVEIGMMNVERLEAEQTARLAEQLNAERLAAQAGVERAERFG